MSVPPRSKENVASNLLSRVYVTFLFNTGNVHTLKQNGCDAVARVSFTASNGQDFDKGNLCRRMKRLVMNRGRG